MLEATALEQAKEKIKQAQELGDFNSGDPRRTTKDDLKRFLNFETIALALIANAEQSKRIADNLERINDTLLSCRSI